MRVEPARMHVESSRMRVKSTRIMARLLDTHAGDSFSNGRRHVPAA
jgi:hypothetical protein